MSKNTSIITEYTSVQKMIITECYRTASHTNIIRYIIRINYD
jgi:hypothetical protein